MRKWPSTTDIFTINVSVVYCCGAGLCRRKFFFNVCFIIQERRLQSLRDQNIVVVGGGEPCLCLDLDSHRSQSEIVAGARQ